MLSISVPGDKSISHRGLILASVAAGSSVLRGLPDSDDVLRTVEGLSALGANIQVGSEATVVVGPGNWQPAQEPIFCGNSGTSARLFTGLIAGLGVGAVLDGDESLRRRPMDRIVYPLQAMGARISYRDSPDRLPLEVAARATGTLRPLRHRPRVASAQVKTGLLLAGILSGTRVEVHEPTRSRDHTERLLRWLGAPIEFGPETDGWRVTFDPDRWDGRLSALDLQIPGDPSSAAFLVVTALLAGRPLRIRGVCLNPTRTGYLNVLREAGAEIVVEESPDAAPEPVGDLVVRPSSLRAFRLSGGRLTDAIDEIPILAVAAARAQGVTEIHDAGELRVKESDRLALLASNFQRIGVECDVWADGLRIVGTPQPLAGRIETGGDHRIAMAFAALGALPGAELEIDDPGCARVSYPGFYEALQRVVGRQETS